MADHVHSRGMVLAYDYPLLGVLLSVAWFFIWVLWIMLVFNTVLDVFRSHDLGGFAKALWLVFVFLVPFLGVFVYVVARGDKMGQRAVEAERVPTGGAAGGGNDVADQLARLGEMKAAGTITDADFDAAKAKILR